MSLLQKDRSITIELEDVSLLGNLTIPENATGLVIFSHGSGSSRLSKRNIFVASLLQKKGLGSFLFDLLTEEEDRVYETRFNIELLTTRLVAVTKQLDVHPKTSSFNIGFFGASTGAASALMAAAELKTEVKAIVSRGGRVDMAQEKLAEIKAPTLFIVGEDDEVVLQLNEKAYNRLTCEKKLEIIHGASHLFEEPGTLEEVARLSANWFGKYL